MSTIFQSTPGQVVQLSDPTLQCQTKLIGFRGVDAITYQAQRSIVTRMTISQRVNMQFLHTFSNQIYTYVFGDRIGEITLSGLAFACECPGVMTLGAEMIYGWYAANKASTRAAPIIITLGSTPFKGMLTDFTGDMVDPSVNLFQWNMSLKTVPSQ